MLTPQTLTTEQFCGIVATHVESVPSERAGVLLQPQVAQAYVAMREAAASAGIQLAIASGFRDFNRQLAIWNRKFSGQAPLYNDRGEALNSAALSTGEKVDAILTWSALPGASRHHWGTDFDVYDPEPFASGELKLQLIPEEYDRNGPCHTLYQWLQRHAREFGFFFPYARYQGGVAAEPWHLSHERLANDAHAQLSVEVLKNCLQQHEILGQTYVLEQLPEIKRRYIDCICHADIHTGDVWFG